MKAYKSERVGAIIVTRDRLKLLKDVIKALNGQSVPLSEIIVVDNSDQTSTKKFVQTLNRVQYIKLNKNVGGAGGFHIGMRVALFFSLDFFWLIDDDSFPQKDSLEKLIRAHRYFKNQKTTIGFLASKVVWTDGKIHKMNPCMPRRYDWAFDFSPDRPYVKVESSSFVSFLIPKNLVSKEGLPIFDFFIWFDDVEFSARISKKYDSYCILDSVVTHRTQKNQGADPRYIAKENVKKYACGIRNQVWCLLRSGRLGIFRAFYFLLRNYFLMRDEKVKFSLIAQIIFTGLSAFFVCFNKENITNEKLKSLIEFSNIDENKLYPGRTKTKNLFL